MNAQWLFISVVPYYICLFRNWLKFCLSVLHFCFTESVENIKICGLSNTVKLQACHLLRSS